MSLVARAIEAKQDPKPNNAQNQMPVMLCLTSNDPNRRMVFLSWWTSALKQAPLKAEATGLVCMCMMCMHLPSSLLKEVEDFFKKDGSFQTLTARQLLWQPQVLRKMWVTQWRPSCTPCLCSLSQQKEVLVLSCFIVF